MRVILPAVDHQVSMPRLPLSGPFRAKKMGFFNNYNGRFFILLAVGFFEFEHRANNFLLIFFFFNDFFSESISVAEVAIISHESVGCNVVTIIFFFHNRS